MVIDLNPLFFIVKHVERKNCLHLTCANIVVIFILKFDQISQISRVKYNQICRVSRYNMSSRISRYNQISRVSRYNQISSKEI